MLFFMVKYNICRVNKQLSHWIFTHQSILYLNLSKELNPSLNMWKLYLISLSLYQLLRNWFDVTFTNFKIFNYFDKCTDEVHWWVKIQRQNYLLTQHLWFFFFNKLWYVELISINVKWAYIWPIRNLLGHNHCDPNP
jgi:hypothetical protein